MKNRSNIDEQIANQSSDLAGKMTATKISDLSDAEIEAVSGGDWLEEMSEIS